MFADNIFPPHQANCSDSNLVDLSFIYVLPYLSFLVPVKNEFVTTISPALHLK